MKSSIRFVTLVDSVLIHLQFTLERRLVGGGRVEEVGGGARGEVHRRATIRAWSQELVLRLCFDGRVRVELALEKKRYLGVYFFGIHNLLACGFRLNDRKTGDSAAICGRNLCRNPDSVFSTGFLLTFLVK